MNWDSPEISSLIKEALQEDLGPGDITSAVIIPENAEASAVFLAKQAGTLAGLPLLKRIFLQLDPHVTSSELLVDGSRFVAGSVLCKISGNARALLGGERVALNLLQRLTGIATQTSEFVDLASPHGISILDTRKTTPLFRKLEKYAVQMGGAVNHRFGLFDGVMVKDNHLQLEPDFKKILERFKTQGYPAEKVEIEVTSAKMLLRGIEAGVVWFLLDNMSPSEIRECVKWKRPGMRYEVSGGVSRSNFEEFLIRGVDAISIGALTHSVKSADISMEFEAHTGSAKAQ
jgi:nicotinate-nucleotide pyrophosphorylase (carboxylating)